MNVTRLSKTLNLTIQEVSRNVQRLRQSGLVKVDSSGLHCVSGYGKAVLIQLLGLQFLSLHSDYFRDHSVNRLPRDFVYRIGELADCTYVDNSLLLLNNVEKLWKEAEQYVWNLSDEYLVSIYPLQTEAFKRGVKARSLDPIDAVPDLDTFAQIRSKDWQAMGEAVRKGSLEGKLLEHIDVFLWISEKQAVTAFQTVEGRFDYLGFVCKDENSYRWCADLFKYYWSEARSFKSVMDELSDWVGKKPRVVDVLRRVDSGKKAIVGEELLPELQAKHLIKHGKLTGLGKKLYEKLQG